MSLFYFDNRLAGQPVAAQGPDTDKERLEYACDTWLTMQRMGYDFSKLIVFIYMVEWRKELDEKIARETAKDTAKSSEECNDGENDKDGDGEDTSA
ncbi:hypothetical protein OQA88_10725 [Cercophora sp. LCS_1]